MTRRFSNVLLAAALLTAPAALFSQATPGSDEHIRDLVREQLAHDVDVKGAALNIQVKEGNVTLAGRVRTAKAKEKATKLAKKVKGVKTVENKLEISAFL